MSRNKYNSQQANKKTPFKSNLYPCILNHIILKSNICTLRGMQGKKNDKFKLKIENLITT